MLKRWAAWPRRARLLIGAIVAIVLALAIAWILFVPAADWLARHDVGSSKGPLLQAARDAARGRLLTLGASLFAAAALIFTALNFNLLRRNSEQSDQWQQRTHELTEQGQVTDRYTRAIEQLGSDKLDVRIGGIYALERVARDSGRDHLTVMEVLSAMVREHSREPWPAPADDGPGADVPERVTRPDVQAAVTVIGRRDVRYDRPPVNLAGADLTRANLAGANLAEADLTRANLAWADLTRANLAGANLSNAYLEGANLTDANLSNAHLEFADLTRADLAGTDLTCADLTWADLTGTHLWGANLSDADLSNAHLTSAYLNRTDRAGADLNRTNRAGADLTRAKLCSADVRHANLYGANLSGADLSNAHLEDANLAEADLTDTNLAGAFMQPAAVIPQGWQRDTDSGRLKRAGTGSGATTTN